MVQQKNKPASSGRLHQWLQQRQGAQIHPCLQRLRIDTITVVLTSDASLCRVWPWRIVRGHCLSAMQMHEARVAVRNALSGWGCTPYSGNDRVGDVHDGGGGEIPWVQSQEVVEVEIVHARAVGAGPGDRLR